jgi:hypothetical protein
LRACARYYAAPARGREPCGSGSPVLLCSRPFAVQVTVEVARTDDIPENFLLFAPGFLLIFLAHVLVVSPLRRLLMGSEWVFLLVAPGYAIH